jgi:predicted GNAT family acetyltransferase
MGGHVRIRRKRQGLSPKPGTDEVSVTNVSEKKRYEISSDGVQAGLAAYVDTRNHRIFYHTEIDDKFAGRGLASTLIGAALDDTRTAGKRVVAICPFVSAYADKHEDYDDLLDPITPQAHAAVQAEIS